MNILVTGASGFLGNVLCRKLYAEGHRITAIALDATSARSLADLDIVKVDADIRDQEKIAYHMQNQDIFFHLASIILITKDHQKKMHSVNVDGLKIVAEAALKAKVKRFIHVSSIHSLYRFPRNEIIDEKRPLALSKKEFDYDRTKAEGELELLKIAEKGLDVVIVNPTCFIGPYDFEPSLMGDVLRDFFRQKVIPYFSGGGFNFVDVRDVADTLVNTITYAKSGERYIVAGEWESVGELIKKVIDARGFKGLKIRIPSIFADLSVHGLMFYWKFFGKKVLFSDQSLGHLKFHRLIDDSKARKELQHKSRPLSETFRDLKEWLQMV